VNQAASGRGQLIGQAFVSLADTLVADYDVIDLLTRLIDYSVRLVPADAGGIVLADPSGQLRVVAASSEEARLTELMQLQADQGPCLDCYRDGASVSVLDLAEAVGRWPMFVAAATAAGEPVFRAVHAVPLRVRGEAIGVLNLFRHRRGAIPPDDLAVGQALADVATVAILAERAIRRAETVNEQLQVALTSRVIIEQAKGVLAQHATLSMDRAFDLMRRYARASNERLSDVARAITERTLDLNAVVPPSEGPRKA
jgi:GAF domain-containing protein